jgi:ATP-dependent helicase HrpB
MLTMAAEVKTEWLHEYFSDNYQNRRVFEWNSLTKAIECKAQTLCLGVVVEEQVQPCIDVPEAADLLAETILTKELVLPLWNDAVIDWINRVRWVAGMFPEQNLPEFNDNDRRMVVHILCDGEYRYARVAEKPVLPVLMEMLSQQQLRFIEAVAPQTILLPSNRKLKITYEPNSLPRGRARIQELYGLKQSPRIAENRIAVPIEILAPNNRPVQITDDMERFWTHHYPELKKTLSRRYPKHEWR